MDNQQFSQLMNKLDEISKKLSILIAPQFKRESKKQDKEITHENIRKLRDCGLNYIEIAGILDMSSGTVANELTNMKKKVNSKQESPAATANTEEQTALPEDTSEKKEGEEIQNE